MQDTILFKHFTALKAKPKTLKVFIKKLQALGYTGTYQYVEKAKYVVTFMHGEFMPLSSDPANEGLYKVFRASKMNEALKHASKTY